MSSLFNAEKNINSKDRNIFLAYNKLLNRLNKIRKCIETTQFSVSVVHSLNAIFNKIIFNFNMHRRQFLYYFFLCCVFHFFCFFVQAIVFLCVLFLFFLLLSFFLWEIIIFRRNKGKTTNLNTKMLHFFLKYIFAALLFVFFFLFLAFHRHDICIYFGDLLEGILHFSYFQ